MPEETDVIIVAREGYKVLLNVGPQTLDIDSYSPVNLSKLFGEEILKKCASLRSHIEDGNLVYFVGQDLPKDPNAILIKKLEEVSAKQLDVSIHAKSSDISPATSREIITRVVKNKEAILAQDRKILTKTVDVADANSLNSLKLRGKAKTTKELKMAVQMDISPEEFKKRQATKGQGLQDKVMSEQKRALKEIKEAKPRDNDDKE